MSDTERQPEPLIVDPEDAGDEDGIDAEAVEAFEMLEAERAGL